MEIQKFRGTLVLGGVSIWMLVSSYYIENMDMTIGNQKRRWYERLNIVGEFFTPLGAVLSYATVGIFISEAIDSYSEN